MAKYNMAKLTALADQGGYSGLLLLNNLSVVMALSSLGLLRHDYLWQPGSYNLTQAEIDEIQAAIDQLEYELTTNMIGAIITSVSKDTPPGCLLCDGSAHSKSAYPELYDSIDPVYVIDASNFRVPNYNGKTLLGASPGEYAIGDTGGKKQVYLTLDQIPSHYHTYWYYLTSAVTVGAGAPVPAATAPSLQGTTGNAGGNQPHENMPPYEVVKYYIVAGR